MQGCILSFKLIECAHLSAGRKANRIQQKQPLKAGGCMPIYDMRGLMPPSSPPFSCNIRQVQLGSHAALRFTHIKGGSPP